MYIIIVGCGKVGYHLTKALIDADEEVLAIEQDPQRHAAIVDELGSIAISGDGSEMAVLAEAGATRADVLIAVTGQDEDNLVACQGAKHRFNVKKTIAMVNNPENESLFQDLGVDVVVSHTNMILTHVEEELPEHHLVHIMPFQRSHLQLVEIRVPEDAEVIGKPLGQIVLPRDTFISLIVRRNGEPKMPSPTEAIQANDDVILVTPPQTDQEILEILTKVSEQR